MSKFEFTVQRKGDRCYTDEEIVNSPWANKNMVHGSYCVSLPHSCDEWVITGGQDKEEAIKEMEQFIKEAQEALEELKR